MNTPDPWGYSENADQRKSIYQTVNIGNTIYIGGNFQNIGPNTGTGVIMNDQGSEILTYKKWRINGPVYSSVPDGNGGYFIGGLFTKVGDSTRNNIAHINSNGIPSSWKPDVNDFVKAMVIYKDTLIIGGKFTSINGQTRNAFAMLNINSGVVLPATFVNNTLKPGTLIHTFCLADTNLYVGGKYNLYNTVGAFFKVNIKSGGASNFPDMFQLGDVYSIDVSQGKRKIYIGGSASGGLANSNGFCIDANTNSLLFKIDIGVINKPGVGEIFGIKCLGGNVYVGGRFNFGIVGGNNFNQKGLMAFDTATGIIRPYLNNCDGIISSIHTKGNKVYLAGEFNSIGGVNRMNFAVFDTTLKSVANNSLSISDKVKTIAFAGTNMFIGGFFQSVGCIQRNGFAAFDISTGQITPWAPNIYANSLTDMKAKGDTVFMSGNFGQVGNSFSLGGFVAVNGNTGSYYSNGLTLAGTCYDMLIDGDYLYTSGFSTFGDSFLGKIYIPTLRNVNTWSPSITFQTKSIQKRNGRIYGVGDMHRANSRKGFLTEINDTTGKVMRTVELGQTDFNWVNSGVLVGSKFFFSGNFSKAMNSARKNFAVFDIDKWEITPINIQVSGFTSLSDLQFRNGNIYFSGSFDSLNSKLHRYFAVIDTSVGAIFPDRLKFNDDKPYAYSLDDDPGYERLNTFLLADNYLITGGNFRNVNKGMFPSIAKLKLTPGNAPATPPQGIAGPDTIFCPSQNNSYSIINPPAGYRYAWFTSGQDITIKNNGSDSILLDIGPLAIPGVLKAVAITECGRSNTVYRTINIKTVEPTVNAANIILVRKSDTTATIRFTRGNGARRIVVLRAASSIANSPQDFLEYTADVSFGAGSNLGNNSFIVYSGNGDSVAIKKLNPMTFYYVTVYEFNGFGVNSNYLTTGNPSFSFTTLAAVPSVQAGNISFTNVTQTSLTITCTPGNGSDRLIVMRINSPASAVKPVNTTAYSPSAIFGSGSDLGNGNFVVSASTSTVNVTNLQPNTIYAVTVFEYNGTGQATNYLTTNFPENKVRTMAPEPTTQASNIVVSAITPISCTINCTPGNGQFRLVVMRKDSAVIFTPKDSIYYGSYSSAFGFGANLDDNTYLMNTATPANVTSLVPNTTYHIAIFEYNGGTWGNNYLTTTVPVASFKTPDYTPTIQASNLSVSSVSTTTAIANCTSGNGANRLFVIREGSPVIDTPVNGKNYPISNGVFGGTNLGNHTYVIARQQPVNISSLSPGKTYYLKVFEYNGSGASSCYKIADAPSVSFTTAGVSLPSEPSQQASAITVSALSSNTATINCTQGNGQNRLVVIRQGTNISSAPLDGNTYTANVVFGSGGNIGSNTYVISNTSTPITVTGLTQQTDYTVSVFEYNGTGSQINYLTSGNIFSTFKTLATKPDTASTNITISAIGSSSATINCTAGDGQSRLVVIKQGATITANPMDGSGYNGNTVFGIGESIGDQTYVLTNSAVPVTVTGLQPQTNYTVKVYEYNGSGNTASYLIAGAPALSFATTAIIPATEPSQQASNIIISAISANTAIINCTPGNGQARLVVIRQGSAITSAPLDGTAYTAYNVFGIGDTLGGSTYIISNTSTPVTVTGLMPQTEYTVSVFEYNGSGPLINYLTSGNSFSTFKTLANKPTTASSDITISAISSSSATINCVAGDGQSRLVVIKQGTTFTANPADGSGYNGNTVFGSGANIGDNVYVLSNSTVPITVTGLQPQTDYTVKVFEYNGSGTTSSYLLTSSPANSFTTTVVTSVINLDIPGTSLEFFPNPITTGKLNIVFKTPKRGDLLVTFSSIHGADLFSKSYPIRNNVTSLNVQLPFSISSGPFIVRCSFLGKRGSLLLLKL